VADALHFEFVSPESVLFSGEVDQVDLPGAEGDMGILAGHAPLVTTLRPGIVTIHRGGAHEPVVVTGGFAEVGPAGLTVLADRAVARENFDLATLSAEIRDAEEDVADATDEAQRDKFAHHLAQLKALQDALGAAGTTAAGH
jgi:F-type H+-transporting ATPase subunit epsilon